MNPELFIEVSRNGQRLGSFSISVARENLKAGILKLDDWAWHEGLSDWVPLHSVNGLVVGELPVAKKAERTRSNRTLKISVYLVITVFVLVGIVFFFRSRPKQEVESPSVLAPAQSSPAQFQDPFAPNSIVYSWVPSGHVLGEKVTIAVCSESYENAYDLMLKESDTNYKVAESLTKQLLKQSYTPEAEYKQSFSNYILDKQEQKRLLFLPQKTKMQIVQKKHQGDPPYRSIYECKVLAPGSEGMIVYIQEEYLTTRP